MKKILLAIIVMAAVSTSFANPPVNEKVLKAFKEVFPTIHNAKWYEHDSYYEVYFVKDEVKCRVKFDLEGKVVSTIRYYDEKMVAPYMKAKLAYKFPGKTIFGVTETNSEDDLVYHFVLEDEDTWTHVKSDVTGQMEVTNKFKKADK